MDEATFWAVIDDARREAGANPAVGEDAEADAGRLAAAVADRLSNRPATDVVAFDELLYAKRREAYTSPLWAAGYLFRGGCSDDGFEYFRLWVISRGRAVFEAAVADPDSLAPLADPDTDDSAYECEPLMYAACDAHERVTGQPLPPTVREPSREPSGENWDFDDNAEMVRHLPRLAAIFLGTADDGDDRADDD